MPANVCAVRAVLDTADLRRCRGEPFVERPTFVSTSPTSSESTSAASPQQTLSQVAGRILDQLSVSAWLPAGILVFLLLLIANLQIADGSLLGAVGRIADLDAAALILLFGAVILTTVLTQAFEFEAIRLLEGYWGTQGIASALVDVRSARHASQLRKLKRQERDVRRRAFPEALLKMRRDVSRETIEVIEDWLVGVKPTGSPSEAALNEARSIYMSFMEYAATKYIRRCRSLVLAQEQYPPESLVLPTRLGNTLRSYEHPLDRGDGRSIQNFVREIYHELPMTMRSEHDQFRSRLDLYCSLVLIFVLSGALAGGVLATVGLETGGIAAALGLVLAWLSYRAAVASAREYGRVLRAIADSRVHNLSPGRPITIPPTARQ